MFQNIDLLKSAMDVSTLTTQVIANNIANADTPNFKASYVMMKVSDKKIEPEFTRIIRHP
ncbi:flagellar basal body rod protein FlgB [Athalassotoga saccharophila]|uniref:flagellar basal body rod protein FlgB n=1 Tax=Athalassotoga saccharophila TaxID=1441386 RepID=UPI0018D61D7E|nr:flagellar basal body protein [Athalassotoga saccharophila]BBJ27744.1 flagellar basal-body rod protein FlgB [Athalassotoga saccharophila]